MNAAEYPFRIENLSIRNYKGIDALDIEFPLSPIAGSPDVVAIGSRNGVGKSSVLECCALLLAIPRLFDKGDDKISFGGVDDIIRAGAEVAHVKGRVTSGDNKSTAILAFERDGETVAVKDRNGIFDESLASFGDPWHRIIRDNMVAHILGQVSDPVRIPNGLLFHSFRRVSGTHVESDAILRSPGVYEAGDFDEVYSMNVFKSIVLREMMYEKGLIEDSSSRRDQGRVLMVLNDIIERYAGGKLGRLRPLAGNGYDIRIDPGGRAKSFTINGLSSGQMEVISTLFLIWHATRDMPSVVLIDEPELHLNAEWHGEFVSSLVESAPQNQYVLATHSEDVMASVAPECRIILTREDASPE